MVVLGLPWATICSFSPLAITLLTNAPERQWPARGFLSEGYGEATAGWPTIASISSKERALVSKPMSQKAIAPTIHQDAK